MPTALNGRKGGTRRLAKAWCIDLLISRAREVCSVWRFWPEDRHFRSHFVHINQLTGRGNDEEACVNEEIREN